MWENFQALQRNQRNFKENFIGKFSQPNYRKKNAPVKNTPTGYPDLKKDPPLKFQHNVNFPTLSYRP